MAGKTPAQALQYYRSLSHPAIAAMPIVILDHLAPHIADLFNLSQIPWDHSPRNIKKLNETLAYYKGLKKTAREGRSGKKLVLISSVWRA